jgi:hypothetical protein
MSNEKPLIFISHKHTDKDIATAIADVIKNRTLNGVRIYQSSNWKFDGPRFGPGLNNELRQALWNSDALILIYTSEDQNWQYCMYECGVATQPDSPDTRIVVFQCGRDVPTPFAADLRVDVHNPENIKRFTKQLLTSPTFFPRMGKALAPDADNEALEKTAEELFQKIGEQVADPSNWQTDEWPAWPFLRVELPKLAVEKLELASSADRVKVSRQIVEGHGVVVKSDARAAALFGLNGLQEKHKFGDLLRTWKDNFPRADATWFDSCCEQIMVGARREFPVIRWARLREVGSESEYTPVLSSVKRLPFGSKSTQFDIYFYNLSDPRAVPVESKMIPVSEFFYKSLGQIIPETLRLTDMVKELDQKRLNRIPLFNAENHPLYIVHRSMIDKFIVRRVMSGGGGNPSDLTLADLLADEEMKKVFSNTFVVVKRQASLAEAKDAMVARPGCSDVFVTDEGGHDEPVVGWLTNVVITQSS